MASASEADGSFGDLKELLSELDPTCDDASLPFEVKRRAHALCSRFLGGAWKSMAVDELRLSRMTGGMSNMLFLCRLPAHVYPLHAEPDKVLLRVYFNPEVEGHLVAESVIFTLLSERFLGPRLYGIFHGGRLEEYIPSRPLSCSEIREAAMSQKIAQRLARIHQLDVPISKEPDYICEALDRWLQQLGSGSLLSAGDGILLPVPDTAGGAPLGSLRVTCSDLGEELRKIKGCLCRSGSPVVFCHNDLQEGNILLPTAGCGNIRSQSITSETAPCPAYMHPSGKPRLVVIDFEYASYNYRAFDFANHFCEWALDYGVDRAPFFTVDTANFPSADEQRRFFESYLEATGRERPFDSDVARAVAETRAFVAVSHFFWGVWSLLQVELSPVGFDFKEYGRRRLGLYFETRAQLFSHRSPSVDGAVVSAVP